MTLQAIFAVARPIAFSLSVLSVASPSVLAQQLSEIGASGEAWARIAPDSTTVTMLLEERGATAKAVALALDKRVEGLEKALRDGGFGSSSAQQLLFARGTEFADPALQNGDLTKATSTIKGQRLVAATFQPAERSALFIDTAIKSGANAIVEIQNQVRHSDQLLAAGHVAALKRAKKNAELVAESLGVKLGKLLSASVTQDREEDLVEREREEGPAPTGAADQEIRFTAAVRYEPIPLP